MAYNVFLLFAAIAVTIIVCVGYYLIRQVSALNLSSSQAALDNYYAGVAMWVDKSQQKTFSIKYSPQEANDVYVVTVTNNGVKDVQVDLEISANDMPLDFVVDYPKGSNIVAKGGSGQFTINIIWQGGEVEKANYTADYITVTVTSTQIE
jgi:hypothetical protein